MSAARSSIHLWQENENFMCHIFSFDHIKTIVKKISVLSVGHLGSSLSSADLVELSSVDLVDRAFFLFPRNGEFSIVFVI